MNNETIIEINPLTFLKTLIGKIKEGWHIKFLKLDHQSGFTAYHAEIEKYEV
jgi:hypothetical protein